MKKSLITCTLLAAFALVSSLNAEIDFVFVIKGRIFEQSGNMEASTPKDWAFGAGVEGNSQVTGGTITYPGLPGPVNLPGEDGEYELDIQGYTAQSFLDNDYLNGNVTLSITDNGSTQNLGSLSITGDAYPVVPHILNAQDLQFHDLSQDYTLRWKSYAGSTPDDEILIQIWDNDIDDEILFDFLAPVDRTPNFVPSQMRL